MSRPSPLKSRLSHRHAKPRALQSLCTGVTYLKRVVLLASSRKPGGRCIAGKEALSTGYGDWIRPVSPRPTAEVSARERRYEDGGEPALLDIVEIAMVAPVAHAHQIENHEFDPRRRWRKAAVRRWSDLPEIVDHPVSLWGGGDSTRYGLHDRITQEAATNFGTSLWLVRPHRVRIHLLTRGEVIEKTQEDRPGRVLAWLLQVRFPSDRPVGRTCAARPARWSLPDARRSVLLRQPDRTS